jgi:hypothetical protein
VLTEKCSRGIYGVSRGVARFDTTTSYFAFDMAKTDGTWIRHEEGKISLEESRID